MMDLQTIQALNAKTSEEANGKHRHDEYADWEHELLADGPKTRWTARHWNGFEK